MATETISKRCSKCKEIKPLSEFYRNRSKRNGLENCCKICSEKTIKKYNQTERGKKVRKLADYKYQRSEKNKVNQRHYAQSEKGKANFKRYQQSEKGKITRRNYLKSEKGKSSMIAGRKRYNIAHPERIEAKIAVQCAVAKGILPKVESLRCHYCPRIANQYHHHKGYESEHWLDVIPICYVCHGKTRLAS